MTLDDLRQRFLAPLPDDRLWPFWFWNDDLDDAELVRQIDDFAAHGCGGFVIHPRLGLSRAVGYLTPRWFHHCRVACAAARERGLKVLLYDEAMYPSGAAGGLVTREHPELRARALGRQVLEFDGPTRRYWRVFAGEPFDDRLVAARLVAPDGSATPLDVDARGLARLEVGPGHWRAEAFCDVPSGATIRGVFVGEDDGEATAPPAGDLLNPAAVARFMEVTHEGYAAALGEFFGDTVVGIFVDEPGLLGRGARRRDVLPWTSGLEQLWREREGEAPLDWLPHLFEAAHPVQERWRRFLARRLNETFYQPLARWCESRGLALVGHPAESDDLTALAAFTWPGQDMVWRYIEPGRPSALEGPHSTAARCATSAKHLYGRARAATECGGAYGWQTTADELKWLFDWHLSRGNDLFCPHAFYYSLAGPRAFERPPDLGPHNLWWPYFRPLADYVARVCALLRVGQPCVEVALAADPERLPWSSAKVLTQRQVDFDYVPEARADLLARYRCVVSDDESAATVDARVLTTAEPCPDLRAWQVAVGAARVLFVVNEGESALTAACTHALVGALEVWDPLTGAMTPHGARVGRDGLEFSLSLARRQGLLLVLDPAREPAEAPAEPAWRLFAELTQWQPRALGDWCEERALETFAGTLTYRTSFSAPAGRYRLDLGRVEQLAAVTVDGQFVGASLWAPHELEMDLSKDGEHALEVGVSNSRSNELCGTLSPSGLCGPVLVWQQA